MDKTFRIEKKYNSFKNWHNYLLSGLTWQEARGAIKALRVQGAGQYRAVCEQTDLEEKFIVEK